MSRQEEIKARNQSKRQPHTKVTSDKTTIQKTGKEKNTRKNTVNCYDTFS